MNDQQMTPNAMESPARPTTNAERGTIMEPTLAERFQSMIRRSYGISKISSAVNLKSLRNDVRTLQSDLNVQIEEMNASAEGIADDLDRLALKDEVKSVQAQGVKLDEVLVKIEAKVAELLNA